MKRENGFYWVKIMSGAASQWTVLEYSNGYWLHKGGAYQGDNSVLEIDEQRIVRILKD